MAKEIPLGAHKLSEQVLSWQKFDNNLLLKELSFSNEMHIMDFGSGTGLLLSQIAPFVNEITAVDISASMIGVLQSKMDDIDCKLQILELDNKRNIRQKI